MKIETSITAEEQDPAFRGVVIHDYNPLSGRRKYRHLDVPNQTMKKIHRRFLLILRKLPVSSYSMACRRGDSPLKAIRKHRGNRFFYVVDIKDAYQAVVIDRMVEALGLLGLGNLDEGVNVKVFLERYCVSARGGLATGSPSSPDLFNLYCAFAIDGKIAEICKAKNLTFTRYLDDIIVSSPSAISRTTRRKIRSVLTTNGFVINHRKSEVRDLRKGAIILLGIGMNEKGKFFIPRNYLRDCERTLRLSATLSVICGKMGPILHLANSTQLSYKAKRVVQMYQMWRRRRFK